MNFIESIVLRPFSYSEDGITPKFAKDGVTFNCPEGLFAGLNKEGFVRRAIIGDGHISLNPPPAPADIPAADPGGEADPAEDPDQVDPSSVEIPDDWGSLKFFSLRSLAAKFTTAPAATLTTETATAAIEAELLRRIAANAAAAGAQPPEAPVVEAPPAGPPVTAPEPPPALPAV